MAKASLDQDTAVRRDGGREPRHLSALDHARLNIADQIDALSLATAIGRHRRGEDFGPQLDILATNYRRRQTILGRTDRP
jgi:hypothetical protein